MSYNNNTETTSTELSGNQESTLVSPAFSQTLVAIENSQAKNISFVIDKSQKVLSALYMVTDLFPEDEYLRKSLRNSAGLALDAAFSLSLLSDTKNQLIELDYAWYKAMLVLETSFKAQFISSMNYQVLFTEVKTLRTRVRDLYETSLETEKADKLKSLALLQLQKVESVSVDTIFTESNSDTENFKEELKKETEKTDDIVNISSEQNVPSHYFEKNSAIKKDKVVVESTQVLNSVITEKPKKKQIKKTDNSEKPSSGKKEERLTKIKDILVAQPEISITDISSGINGCSSKTIQRDLNAMIDAGLVMKKGDRRWATYSLR